MHRSKECFKCKQNLPLTEFYKHPQMGDGHLGKCKECTKKDVLEHRIKNVDRIRAYDRIRSKRPEAKKYAAIALKKWRASDARISSVHNKVARAIRSGELERKDCEVCGRKDSHAHHDNYDEPLSVKWLCPVHHSARHKWLAENGINPYERESC